MKASGVTVRGVHIFRGHRLRVLLRMARTGVPGDDRSGERNTQDDIVAVWWQRSGSQVFADTGTRAADQGICAGAPPTQGITCASGRSERYKRKPVWE
jgi:hypothetical protein